MTVLCNAVTCIHNSKYGDGPSLGECTLKLIALMNVEKEDYTPDVMACQLYQQKKSAGGANQERTKRITNKQSITRMGGIVNENRR